MAPDVSRALARFLGVMEIGQAAARELAAQFADVKSAEELPAWVIDVDVPTPVAAKFNPAEPRDEQGQWSLMGAIKDALKLLGKIDLGKDEHLLGSGKVDADMGGARFALIRGADDTPSWRVGFGGEGFGQAVPDEDIPAWDGNPSAGEFNQTADLDDAGIDALRAQVTSAFARADGAGSAEATFGDGVIPGTRWGDIHWKVYLDDPAADPAGPELSIGVLPKSDPKWQDGRDWQGYFDASEWRKLLRQIEAARAAGQVQAAAGIDTHPGGEQLKHYWLHGEGAAKWSTWTELYHHLVKYLSPGMAKRTAAEWYHLRFGIWPGSDKNRVMHGKPPRGHVVGPG